MIPIFLLVFPTQHIGDEHQLVTGFPSTGKNENKYCDKYDASVYRHAVEYILRQSRGESRLIPNE